MQTTQTATGLGTLVYTVTVTDNAGCVEIRNIDVDNTGGPQVNPPTVTHPLCNGQTNGSATVTWTGGTGFVIAAWRVPNLVVGTPSVSNLAPGTYTVGVGDFSGCADSIRFTVIDPPLVTVSVAPVQTTCGENNGSITATGAGGTGTLTYNWSNSQTGATITGLAPGAYTVTVTDQNNCPANTSTTINGSSRPTISLTGTLNVSCNGGNDGQATVSATGGAGGYSYTWSTVPVQTNATATGLSAGNYSVTVTDAAACRDTLLLVSITEPTAVTASVSTVAVGCNVGNPNGTATVTPGGGMGGYTYQWSTVPVQTTATATGLAAGNYTVTVTDANGCDAIASGTVGTVSSPTVTAGADQTFCAGTPGVVVSAVGSGGLAGYTYSWTCATGPCNISSTSDDNPTVIPATTQQYYVQVTDANGCVSNLDSVLVTVLAQPQAAAGTDVTICSGDTVQLNGSASGAGPAYTYTWTPAANLSANNIASPLAFPPFTTNYILNVSSNGCAGRPDTVRVNVNPVPSINAGSGFSTCFGNQATLTATSAGANPVTFTWLANGSVISTGPSNLNVTPTATTTYSVVANSANGCSSDTADVVLQVIPFPQANAGPDRTICGTDSVQLLGGIYFLPGDTLINQSGVVYAWTPSSGLGSTSIPQPNAAPSSTTTYTLSVTHQGCTSLNTVNVEVYAEPVAVASASDSSFCDDQTATLSSAGSSGTTFNWSPATLVSNASDPNPTAFPNDTTTFILTVSNGPCLDRDTLVLNVQTVPDAQFFTSDTIVCERQVIEFFNTSLNGLGVTWHFGDGRIETQDTIHSHSYATDGSYPVLLEVIGEGGCSDSQTLTIEVLEGPRALFETDPPMTEPLTFPAPQVTFTEQAVDGVEWHWIFGDSGSASGPQVVHIFNGPGTFLNEMLVIDEEGCRDSIRLAITILDGSVQDYNVFTPNGDGINDFFLLDYNGTREYTLGIYDRWGHQIFLSKNRMEGWDGRNASGAEMPDGVYFYTLWVGPDRHVTGNVTLMR